jgi:hypothetical protein
MPGEIFVDLSYRGLEIGRRHKMCEVGPTTAYVEHPTPMPVGSRLAIVADGVELEVEVVRVHEQVAGAERSPGMRVKAPSLSAAAATLWQSLISVDDPVVPPIPLVAPPMSRAPRPPAEDEAEHPGVAVMAAKGRMSIAMPAAAGGAGDAERSIREARTERMPAVDIEKITATAKDAAEPEAALEPPPAEPEPAGKKKRAPRKRAPKK